MQWSPAHAECRFRPSWFVFNERGGGDVDCPGRTSSAQPVAGDVRNRQSAVACLRAAAGAQEGTVRRSLRRQAAELLLPRSRLGTPRAVA
jgi:hypothetical protein